MSWVACVVLGYLLAAVPAAVLLGKVIAAGERERLRHFEDQREILNRVQFPAAMPTGRRSAAATQPAPTVLSASDRAREMWTSAGTVDPPSSNGIGEDIP